MPFDFVLPDLGEGITEGEIRKWLVKEGDSVDEHQAVLEIETDKAVVQVPSPKKGFVLKIHIKEGGIANVGDALLTIGDKTEEEKLVPEGLNQGAEKKSHSVVGVLPEAEEILAAPAVRNLAKKTGVILENIKGTGAGGVVRQAAGGGERGEAAGGTGARAGQGKAVGFRGQSRC